MGQVAYRANLSSATFPMTIADGGRTVIVPGPDQNFDRRVDPEGEQKDAGIPQALYMENVVPTVNGYQSVGYIRPTLNMTLASGRTIVHKIEVMAVTSSNTKLPVTLYVDSTGVFSVGIDGRSSVTFSGTAPGSSVLLSTAMVGNKSYLYDAISYRLYEITAAPGITLTNVTASVTPANFFSTNTISSIAGSNNYLIASAFDRIYYSSLTTPTDFVASLVSGAGSIIPNNLSGAILRVVSSAVGFYVITPDVVIAAEYTGNARYPWKFIVVKGLSGVKSTANSTDLQYSIYSNAYTQSAIIVGKNGEIKILQRDQAQSLLPELDDFLTNKVQQDSLNYTTSAITSQALFTLEPRVFVVGARYFIVSINDSSTTTAFAGQYTHAMLYDSMTQRAGKLKITHDFITEVDLEIAAFAGPDPSFQGGKNKKLIAFVDGVLGRIAYVNFDIYNFTALNNASYEAAQGALLLGKFQYVRSRMMQMEEIEIEGPQNTAIVPSPNFSLALIPSTDGRNFDAPITLTPRSINGGLAVYNCHHTAQNHSILIKGAFSINTLQLKFVPGGER
jgi:hypothetical protein